MLAAVAVMATRLVDQVVPVVEVLVHQPQVARPLTGQRTLVEVAAALTVQSILVRAVLAW
jgi:hypothetical protein